MVMKKYIVLLVLAMLCFAGYAQVTVKLQAPAQCEVGQRIRISYVVNTQEVEDIQVGEFPGFDLLYGPSTSTQSSYSIVNGKSTSSSSMTFSYTLLASKEGHYKVPAASVKSGGRIYKSAGASIEILPSSGGGGGAHAQSGGAPRASEPRRQGGQQGLGKDDLFIAVTANKKKVFEQEAVVVTYKLYTLVNIRQLSGEMPELDDCHVQELDTKAQMSLKYERHNGRNYGTAVWRQYVLFPQKTGKISIPSVSFDAEVELTNPSADPFDIFFGGGALTQMVKKTIAAPALEIEVAALPTPRPAAFTGAVGHFTMTGTLSPDQVNANDAATLRLVVSGQGNMKLMKAPKVSFPKDFEIYDPKEDNKTVMSASGSKGNVVFDYVVVPRHGGRYSVPPVEFVYFDPDDASYKTLRTDSFHIAVARGKESHSVQTHSQEDLKVLSSDIHYIKGGGPKLKSQSVTFFMTQTFWGAYTACLLAFVTLLAIFFRKAKENANIAGMRRKRAGKAAAKRLKVAAKLLKAHDAGAFYDETLRALIGYAGDKLSLPTAELSKERISEEMLSRGVDEALVARYIRVMDDCEFARFAPGNPEETMDKLFAEATDVINEME